MDIFAVLHDYGWAGVLLLLVVEKAMPFFGRFLSTEQRRRVATEEAERRRAAAIEERQVAAFEQVSKALSELVPILARLQVQMEGVSADTKATLVTVGEIRVMLDRPTAPARNRKAVGDG